MENNMNLQLVATGLVIFYIGLNNYKLETNFVIKLCIVVCCHNNISQLNNRLIKRLNYSRF